MVQIGLRHRQHVLLSLWAIDGVMLTSLGVVRSRCVTGSLGIPELVEADHVGGYGVHPFQDLGTKVDKESITGPLAE